MFSFIKKIFGGAQEAAPEVPYKVEVAPVVTEAPKVEAAPAVVKPAAKKPAAKKPAAKQPAKRPAKKSTKK